MRSGSILNCCGEPAFRIIGNLYYVGNSNVSSHLIASEEGHPLVDTGFATTTPLLLSSIRGLGFEERDVGLIIKTHGHEDHAGGNRRVMAATGALSALHRDDLETVEKGTELTCEYYIYGVEAFETFKVNMVLRGGEEFTFVDARIRTHHTPGNTPGTLTLEIDVEEEAKPFKAFLFGGPGNGPLSGCTGRRAIWGIRRTTQGP